MKNVEEQGMSLVNKLFVVVVSKFLFNIKVNLTIK
jgi:hypothetical protein